MSWAEHHRESERLASEAEAAARIGDIATARRLYARAARAEMSALSCVGPDKSRTLGITAVSAAALWYHAGDLEEAERVSRRFSTLPGLPAFAAVELRSLLETIRSNTVARRAEGAGGGSRSSPRMAKNKRSGHEERIGAVKERPQRANAVIGTWTKRDDKTGKLMDVKADPKPSKDVRKEKKAR